MNKYHYLGGNKLSESAEKDIMSRLNELEQKLSNLDNIANALEDELEDLQATSRELNLKDFVDKFGKYIEEVEKVKADVSCGMFADVKNEQMKELVESRAKTVPKDIENLRNEYDYVREKLVELREEIDKGKSSNEG